MMNDIIFNWIRGDDEFETLVITNDDDTPIDLSNSRFDLHIAPDRSDERIKLSTESGEITVNQNEVTLHIAHDVTRDSAWKVAKWDLQETTSNNLVRTLCSGRIHLKHDVTRL